MSAGSECASASTAHLDRTFFIVDLYRLCDETDTLQNALAVYKPEADLRWWVGGKAWKGWNREGVTFSC